MEDTLDKELAEKAEIYLLVLEIILASQTTKPILVLDPKQLSGFLIKIAMINLSVSLNIYRRFSSHSSVYGSLVIPK